MESEMILLYVHIHRQVGVEIYQVQVNKTNRTWSLKEHGDAIIHNMAIVLSN